MKKRLFSVYLIICLVSFYLPCFSTPAKAAGGVFEGSFGQSYSTLAEAYDSATISEVIQMNGDISGVQEITLVENKQITLDGGGYSITGNNTALIIHGSGTILLKNIRLYGGVADNNILSVGLLVDENATVECDGIVSAYGGSGPNLLSSYGLKNMGTSAVNITNSIGYDCTNLSIGAYNGGTGTINVNFASSNEAADSYGCSNYQGVINVNYALAGGTKNSRGINNNLGTVNADTAGTSNTTNNGYAAYNSIFGWTNVRELHGKSEFTNTNVRELKLNRGDTNTCLLDHIYVSSTVNTKIGMLPQVLGTGFSYYWYLDSARTLILETGIISLDTPELFAACNVAPVISNVTLSNVTANSVSFASAYTTDMYSSMIGNKGFEWKKVSASTYTKVILGESDFKTVIAGLEPNTSYEVRAFVESGGTRYGAVKTFTTLPLAPSLDSIDFGNQSATIHWEDVGTSNYNVYKSTSREGSYDLADSTTDCEYTISGLTNGIPYYFKVAAVNSTGEGICSNILGATPKTIPGAPGNVAATAGDKQATVSFNPPAVNGGCSISGYNVTVSPGGKTVTGTSSPIVITNLDNGTSYTFTVISVNEVGNSVASTVSNGVIPSAPATTTPTAVPTATQTPAPTTVPTATQTPVQTAIPTATPKPASSSAPTSVTMKATTDKSSKATVTISKAKIDKMIKNDTQSLVITSKMAILQFDRKALLSIDRQASKGITIQVKKLTPSSLSKAQKNSVGKMPVYIFTITSQGKNISTLGKCKVTITIPYKLRTGQTAKNVVAFTLSDKGKLVKTIKSKYLNKKIVFETAKITKYCIGKK